MAVVVTMGIVIVAMAMSRMGMRVIMVHVVRIPHIDIRIAYFYA